MKSYPQYPIYKSSGIEWLGDVPSHWEVKRMRFMLTMNPSKHEISKLPVDTEVSFFPMEAVGENGELSYDQTRAIDDVSSGYTYFGENDVAFAKITPCFENGKGAILRNLVCGCGFGTTELTILRCADRLDPEFLFHVTKSNLFRQNGEAWMYGAGGQKRVPDEYVKNLRFSLPPLSEQKAIATFLDRETKRIDGLIRKREKLIVLLQEKRAALISRAVTKGLNPSARMKPSGIDWLGDVPAHWEVKRTRFMLTMNPSKREIADIFETEGVSFFPMEAVGINGELSYEQTRHISDVSSGYTYFGENDVAFAKITPCFENGKGAIMRNLVNGCGFGTTELTVMRCSKRLDPDFLYHVTKSNIFRKTGEAWMFGAGGQKRVPDEFVKEMRFSYPPLQEQKAIAEYIDFETKKIDGLMEREQQIIERMKEYRSALISAAVTGKIDVREGV